MYKTIGNKIKYLELVDSTNNYLKSLNADKKISEGYLICTKEQFAGRGQRENFWESQIDKNLLFSFIISPIFLKIEEQFILSKSVSIAIANFISQHTTNVRIKWPNDIYVGNRKIAGVLIENSVKGSEISSSVIGIGININQEHFNKCSTNPVSLKILSGKTYNIKDLLHSLIDELNIWYNKLLCGEINMINEFYIESLFRYKQTHNYIVDGEKIKAKIVGIDSVGKLVIETKNDGIRTFAFKEIKYCIY